MPALSPSSSIRGVYLSVIIPVPRLGRELPLGLADAATFLASAPFASELICVVDGSTDHTAGAGSSVIAPLLSGNLVAGRVERHPVRRGRGAAIRTGLSRSRGEWSLVTDAVGSTPVAEVGKLFEVARRAEAAKIALIIGSRLVRGARARALPHRMLAIRIFEILATRQGFSGIRDTTCAFKLYRADLASVIAREGCEETEIADLEHIALARLFGFGVREVGIRWRYRHDEGANDLVGGKSLISLWHDLKKVRARIQRLRIGEEPVRRVVGPRD